MQNGEPKMNLTDVLYKANAGVSTITINRPEVYNAMRLQTLQDMIAALEEASDDPAVGVVVISGVGDKAFCTGGDLGSFDSDKSFLRKTNQHLQRLSFLIRNIPKPVIAAVNGLCLGGGNELNLFCDLSVASEQARFGQPEVRVGTAPLWGGTQLLPRILGEKKAREMLFFCREYSAQKAYELGLVNKVVAHEKLYEEVHLWCEELLTMSPQSLRIVKLSLNFETDQLLPAFNHGMAMVDLLWESKELAEGVNAFREKRKPDFSQYRSC